MENETAIKYFKRALKIVRTTEGEFGICNILLFIVNGNVKKNMSILREILEKYGPPEDAWEGGYYYPLTKKGMKQRIELLKKIIKDLENEKLKNEKSI